MPGVKEGLGLGLSPTCLIRLYCLHHLKEEEPG